MFQKHNKHGFKRNPNFIKTLLSFFYVERPVAYFLSLVCLENRKTQRLIFHI